MGAHPINDTLITRTSEIWLGQDGIVRVKIALSQAEMTIADAIENTETVTQICNGQSRLMLTDARNLKSIDRESRAYFASSQAEKNTKAVAVIINSLLGKMIVNLFTRLSKPAYPTRMFTDEAEALAWLAQFMDEAQQEA